MELGTKFDPSGPISPAKSENKVRYPSFSIRDKKAEEFCKDYPCDLGDELECTVKLRVSGLRKDEYGHNVDLEVQSIDNIKELNADEDEDEDSEEEKTLGYKRPESEKESAPGSAKDLED